MSPSEDTSANGIRGTPSPAFVAIYAMAQVGTYIAFIPLLTLLLPLKAAVIDPSAPGKLLSQVALWGSVTASISGVFAGFLGDRTRRWPGGRSVWITVGLIATALSYILIHRSGSAGELLTAVLILQVGLNFMLNPLAATLAERVPEHRRGFVAGFAGLAFPLASLCGAVVIGLWLTEAASRMTVVMAITIALVMPFIVWNATNPLQTAQSAVPGSLSLNAFADRDFVATFVSRLLVQTAVALNVLYLLYLIGQEGEVLGSAPNRRPETIVSGLLALSTVLSVITGLAAGRLSDRLGRRKIVVFTGAALIASGALVLGCFPSWPGPLVAQTLFGIGIGAYGVTELALAASVLPAPDRTGSDLGLLNAANTGAQILAPAIGLMILGSGARLPVIYLCGSVLAILGATVIMGVRRVR
nr:MFS transporter [Brevundimonas sp. AAP58]